MSKAAVGRENAWTELQDLEVERATNCGVERAQENLEMKTAEYPKHVILQSVERQPQGQVEKRGKDAICCCNREGTKGEGKALTFCMREQVSQTTNPTTLISSFPV